MQSSNSVVNSSENSRTLQKSTVPPPPSVQDASSSHSNLKQKGCDLNQTTARLSLLLQVSEYSSSPSDNLQENPEASTPKLPFTQSRQQKISALKETWENTKKLVENARFLTFRQKQLCREVLKSLEPRQLLFGLICYPSQSKIQAAMTTLKSKLPLYKNSRVVRRPTITANSGPTHEKCS